MIKKKYIYAPGPVTVPPQVLAATAKPIIHHRSSDFDPLFQNVREGLKYVFQTENPVIILASSGTGAMESSIVSTCSPGDHVLSLENGKFGERWGLVAQAFGFDVDRVAVTWGEAPDPNLVEEKLKARPDTKAVYLELCETSTATVSDVRAIAAIVAKTDAILIVDAVSGLCSEELRTDEWGVDMVGCGSQKALMLPPGLGFVSISPKAQEMIKKSKSCKFYFDLGKYLKSMDKNTTPFTPAINLIFGLEASLNMLKEEGMEAIWKRHAENAEAVRRAVKAVNCTLFSKMPANTCTAINVPDGIEGSKLQKVMKANGFTIAGGQDTLKGKIIRIATLGWHNQYDVLTLIGGLEQALYETGHKFDLGAGTTAVQQFFKDLK